MPQKREAQVAPGFPAKWMVMPSTEEDVKDRKGLDCFHREGAESLE